MAMGHERSKPLHNFTLPCGLKWGNQKFLRCAKVDSNGEIAPLHRRSNGSESIGRRREVDVMINHRRSNGVRGFPRETEVDFSRKFRSAGYNTDGGGDGIAAVRKKLMFDLQAEADKMKDAIFREGLEEKQQEEEEEKEVSPTPATATAMASTMIAAAAVDASRPWNLRTRRAACKAPINGIAGGGSNGTLKVDVIRTNCSSPLRTENKSPRLRSEFAGAGDSCTGEKRKRATFSVSLGRREIEEDFMAMVGHRPPRRPKKRAKLVQKNLDTLFPGLWLTEITPDLYKVPDDQ